MQFPIIIEKDENGYYASCPSLKGCSTQGSTYEEAIENIKDAIKLYIDDCLSDNELVTISNSISFQMIDINLNNEKVA